MDNEPREESALQAAKAGRVKFLSHPCKKCGGRLRYTSSRQCVPCVIARATAYQQQVRSALAESRARGEGQ